MKSTSFAVSTYIGKEVSRTLFAGVQLDFITEKYNKNGTKLLRPMLPVGFERKLQEANIRREEKVNYVELGAGHGCCIK